MKNIRLYRLFVIICFSTFLISGLSIGLTFNKNNKKEYIEYISNDYYKTNYDSKKMILNELTEVIYKTNNEDKEEKNILINKNKLSIEKSVENNETNNIQIYNVLNLINDESEYLQVHIKNNNSMSVKTVFKLSFYNENKVLIDELSATDIVLPNVEFAVNYKISHNENYDSYVLSYSASSIDNIITSIDYINKTNAYVVKEDNGELDILFKNITMNKIDILKYTCILYKDDEVVGAFVTSNNVKIPVEYGDGLKCGIKSFNGLSYDNYKIYLSEAYNFNN